MTLPSRRALALCLPLVLAAAGAAPAAAASAVSAATGPVPAPLGAAVRSADALARPNADGHLRPSVHNPLLKQVLAEEHDTVDNPDLSALCQSFLPGGTNPYRDPGSNVDVIVGDRRTQAGSGKGCSTAQNETPIAVNPANPKNLVAGANDYRFFNPREGRNDGGGLAYTSMDGGKTWKDVVLPGLTLMTGAKGALSIMDSAGDPAIAFGPDNHVYYADLVFSRLSTASGMVVSTSADGGLTWGPPAVVELDGVDATGKATPTKIFNDKEWIGVDQASGKVYVTWTEFTYSDASQDTLLASPVVVASSTDRARTFSRATVIGPDTGQIAGHITPFGSGTRPVVGRDGTLYVAYETAVCQTLACDQPTDHDATVVATSKNGGRTFGLKEVGINLDEPVNPDTGRGTPSGEVFRIDSFPSLAYDASTDRLAVTWADDRNGLYTSTGRSVQTNLDVLWSTSTGGARWSAVQTVGSRQDEFFPEVAAGGGKLALSYYTRRYAPWDPLGRFGPATFNLGLDVGLTQVGVGTQRLTTQTSDPRVQFTSVGAVTNNLLSGVFIGDYTGLALGSDGVAHAIWTDFRGNPGVTLPNQDAYTQAVRLK